MILYLSGPMAGYPHYNHPAFHAAARELRIVGYMVLNPAEYGTEVTEWAVCLRRDLYDVLNADAVALLPGWQASPGSQLEVHVARALGMKVSAVHDWMVWAKASAASTEDTSGLSLL